MFKKNITITSSRPVSGKDIKKLKKDAALQFPDVSEDRLGELFPAKCEVILHKLSNRATVYSIQGGNPLFFDPEGRGDLLVPTVYALWKLPDLLGRFYTHSEVSSKVVAGADLYLQGLIVPPEGWGQFQKGDLLTVGIPNNPAPFAVGTAEVGSDELARTGLKGKGLHLLHHFPDQLWALGDKSTPNSGYTLTRIFPLETAAAAPARAGEEAAEKLGDLTLAGEAEDTPKRQGGRGKPCGTTYSSCSITRKGRRPQPG
eukprot:jgi/Botrbrau1/18232/Bobra.53_1s0086.1